MISKLAIAISVSGWLLLVLHLYYDYAISGPQLASHLFHPPHPHEIFFHLLIALAPFISTVMGYLVNERTKLLRKTEQSWKRLGHAAEEWRATFDSMPYGVMLLDGEFNILRANAYISKLLSIPIKDIVGEKCYELIHHRDIAIEGCPLPRSINATSTETREWYEPGLKRYFISYATPLLGEESPVKTYVHSLVDITENKEKENKLISSRDAFLNMLKDLDFSYKELKNLYDGLILSFVTAIDAKSPWTKGHSERVTQYAMQIAGEIGLSNEELERLKLSGLLHDIGKIGTYDILLEKPGKLTDEEFELVKKHPRKGAEILSHIQQMTDVIPGVLYHHERYDGKGYPDGLKEEEIPLYARILCVADCFDAMTADRPYRPAPGKEYAISEFRRCSGTHFDPQVVEAFLNVLNKS